MSYENNPGDLLKRDTEPGMLPDREMIDRYVHPSGALVERLRVWDESMLNPESYAETKRLLDEWDASLARLPDSEPPIFDHEHQTVVPRNQISEAFYSDPSIAEWGLMMPSARALFYLTHLDERRLPSGREVSSNMTRFMREMDDGIGIRTRKRLAAAMVEHTLQKPVVAGEQTALSLACGAADLMVETLSEVDPKTRLNVVDIDSDILTMATELATRHGFKNGENFFTYNEHLVYKMVRSDELVRRFGENSQTVVDAIGINEYFSKPIAKRFLANAFRLVRPGGALVTANMLADRDQMNINKLAIGWPDVYPRSLDEIVDMLDSAGLPLDQTTIQVPQDGIYAVIEVVKPANAS